MALLLLLGHLLLVSVAVASQVFLGTPTAYDSDLFLPLEDLDSLSGSKFTTLKHPEFSSYGVRIKKTRLCDEENGSNPENDDVILWTNGGPGGSSAIGLFVELGPCKIVGKNETRYNPFSWSNHANIIFIDQPIGTGFSYADFGETVDTTEAAAIDIAAFLTIFFEHFTKFKGNAFHFAGESYAGRMLPVFASTLYDHNAYLKEVGIAPVNLSSVMLDAGLVGNGYTDVYSMILSYYDIACTPASVPPVLSISTCVKMKKIVPRCKKWMTEQCLDSFDAINCRAAFSYCREKIGGPYARSGMNPYDISKKGCEHDLCYPEIERVFPSSSTLQVVNLFFDRYMTSFLNLPSTRNALGIDPSFTSNFTPVSIAVYDAFDAQMDQYKRTPLHVAALLERERWTRDMEWSGQEGYGKEVLREWFVDGAKAGVTRSSGGLTFATIEGGGHMAPMDRPRESLELVKRWLSGAEL
uniref:carboxypeptidase C n=1 Tax=Moniliophthora roreri TaxID=221103 RepID=A0A0W0F8J6_MONRR